MTCRLVRSSTLNRSHHNQKISFPPRLLEQRLRATTSAIFRSINSKREAAAGHIKSSDKARGMLAPACDICKTNITRLQLPASGAGGSTGFDSKEGLGADCKSSTRSRPVTLCECWHTILSFSQHKTRSVGSSVDSTSTPQSASAQNIQGLPLRSFHVAMWICGTAKTAHVFQAICSFKLRPRLFRGPLTSTRSSQAGK